MAVATLAEAVPCVVCGTTEATCPRTRTVPHGSALSGSASRDLAV